MKIRLLISGLIVASTFIIFSCDESTPTVASISEPNLVVAADDLEAEEIMNDALAEVDAVVSSETQAFATSSRSMSSPNAGEGNSCRTRIRTIADGKTTITITYNPNCTAEDGIARSGSMVIVIDRGEYGSKGFTKTVTFTDFSLKNSTINGTDVVVNTVEIVSADKKITSKKFSNSHAFNFTMTKTDGTTFTKSGTKLVNQVSGETTWARSDDDYEVSGNSTCTGKVLKDGILVDYSAQMNITTPLYKAHKYRFFTKGVKEITVLDKKTVIDFGDGTQDSFVTITVDGVSEIRDLKDYKEFRKKK